MRAPGTVTATRWRSRRPLLLLALLGLVLAGLLASQAPPADAATADGVDLPRPTWLMPSTRRSPR